MVLLDDSGADWTEDSSVGATKMWTSITSSADGTKLAATVMNGNIWTLDTTATTTTTTETPTTTTEAPPTTTTEALTTTTTTTATTATITEASTSAGIRSSSYREMSSVAVVLATLWMLIH